MSTENMKLLDANNVPKEFQETILKYLFALQNLALYKQDACDYMSPYQLDKIRSIAHNNLVQNVILPILDKNADESLVYVRSKDILSNLDKVWKIYDKTEFDLTNDDCIQWLAIYLWKFIIKTECRYFLEGKTDFIHGIHI